MPASTTRSLHNRHCPSLPHPEWESFPVFRRADFAPYAKQHVIRVVVPLLCRHFSDHLGDGRTDIGPVVDFSFVEKRYDVPDTRFYKRAHHRLVRTEGEVDASTVGIRSGPLDKVIVPLQDLSGHVMIVVASVQPDAPTTTSEDHIQFLLVDPNGWEGTSYTQQQLNFVHGTLCRVFGLASVRNTSLSMPNMQIANDSYDRSLYLYDVKKGLRHVKVETRGFCAYWTYAYLIDICCSSSRTLAHYHFRNMVERASGPPTLSIVKQRHNRLLYLRSVLTWMTREVLVGRDDLPELDHIRRSASSLAGVAKSKSKRS